MALESCFVCNDETANWQRNLQEIRSKHSDSRVSDLLLRILGGFIFNRSIINESNCLCATCLDQINEYDSTCALVKKQEKVLGDIFLSTDTKICQNTKDDCPQTKKTMPRKLGSVTITKVKVKNVVNKEPEIQSNDDICTDNELIDDDSDFDCEEINDDSDDEYLPHKEANKRHKKNISQSLRSDVAELEKAVSNTRSLTNLLVRRNIIPRVKNKCFECGMEFRRKLDLQIHERLHKKSKKTEFRCDLCSFELADQESLDNHKKLHKNKSQMECVICNKVLSSRGNLTVHMKIHGEPNHMCEICGKAFIHSTSFEFHMKFHTNTRPVSCPYCDLKFVSVSHLNRHSQTHKKDKPYSCSICGNRFGYLSNMKAHEKVHTVTDKIHKCSFCDAQFARHSKMIQHMQKNHSASVLHSSGVNKQLKDQTTSSRNEEKNDDSGS